MGPADLDAVEKDKNTGVFCQAHILGLTSIVNKWPQFKSMFPTVYVPKYALLS